MKVETVLTQFGKYVEIYAYREFNGRQQCMRPPTSEGALLWDDCDPTHKLEPFLVCPRELSELIAERLNTLKKLSIGTDAREEPPVNKNKNDYMIGQRVIVALQDGTKGIGTVVYPPLGTLVTDGAIEYVVTLRLPEHKHLVIYSEDRIEALPNGQL